MEDNPDERLLLSEILRSRGHSVTACEDAEKAWDAFRRHPVPLVLLDLVLPGMDGLELSRRIRGHPGGEGAVLLVVTGEEDPGVLERVLEAGADDYVTKPVDVALLNVRLAVAEREVREERDRARTQAELARKSREMEILFRNLDEVFFSLDVPNGRLIQVSPAAHEVLGWAPEDLMADPDLWRRVLYPPELEAQQEAVAGLEPDRMLVHQYPFRRPDGAERWIEASLKAELDSEGRPLRIDAVLSDMTERRRSQEELAARNKELATLYRISEITLTAHSVAGAYEEILEEVCKATGYPVAAVEQYDAARDQLRMVASRGIPDVGHGGPLEIPAASTLSGVAIRTGRPVVEDEAERRPEMADPVLTGLGLRTYLAFPMVVGSEVAGTLMLAHTERVRPEPRLVRWGGSLANSIASFMERVAAEEALKDSERRYRALAEQLQQANQELESFAYSVSHDLRAPLRTMQGFAHALLQNFGDRLDPEARDYAQRIIASGQQSEALIRDLLAYSRLSFEEVELQPVDLGEAVAAAREQIRADIVDAGADVEVEGRLPTVLAHRTTMVQVLANLISNAVKFVPPERTPHVRVGAEEGEDWTRVWVEDNGVGIPPGQEDRIFRVFERLAEEVQRPGTGIGLAIVRRGMERIGGRVGVRRRDDGPGSAFWVEIPRPKDRGAWRPWGRRGRRS